VDKNEAVAWYNCTSRKDWNNWTVEEAQKIIDSNDNPKFFEGVTALELYEQMLVIIKGDDDINN
jgi:hypothetical protein